MSRGLGRRIAAGDAGVEQSGPVNMSFQAVLVSPLAHPIELIQRPRTTSSRIGRILDADQAGMIAAFASGFSHNVTHFLF